MRLNRLLAITIMLINRRKVTAHELADHFGVSIRTIYRDIAAIQAAEIPVVSCQGYDGGFAIMENYRISRQVLTFQDICSILSTLEGINHTLKNSDLANVIEKIGCLVPEDREEEYREISEQIAFDISSWGFLSRQDIHLDLLHKSLASRQVISFVYTDYHAHATQRVVEPMTLIFKANNWYLFGYCRIRKDYRIFRLSRMRDISLTGENFQRKTVSWRDYVPTNPQPKQPVVLELRFSPLSRIRIEEFFSESQIRLREDGYIDVTIAIDDEEWLYSWLLSFADDVQILAPKNIRTQFLNKIEKIRKKY